MIGRGEILFCTSWDDGDKYDMKMAKLLDKFGFKGTFFITTENIREEQIRAADVRCLSTYHEIGSHTLTHPDLTKITEEVAVNEIFRSKSILENLIDKEVQSFCYPYGRYNPSIVDIVRKAGYRYARTTGRLNVTSLENMYLISPTFAIVPRFLSITTAKAFLSAPLRSLLSVSRLEYDILSRANQGGLFFHLWGHSWDVERRNYWDRLADFFSFATDNYRLKCVTFCELAANVPKFAQVR
jgi:peptidoglycan/xylan/chitin deacetylase (PgdA/CDA1 family)